MSESGSGSSLINLGDLTKPATVLIEKIADAIGGLAKPWQMKRVASAEAEAEVLKAQARIGISELEERGLLRMIREEGKKQDNIETITAKAIPLLTSDSHPEKVEADWITNFFDKGRLVSDGDMQQIWANMLAGEANNPGTFSKRAVELVSSFDKSDAEMFTKLCSSAWNIGQLTLCVHDPSDVKLNEIGIDFSAINHLASIGLVTFENLGGFVRQNLPKTFFVLYYGKLVSFEMNAGTDLPIGKVLLTKAGEQLAKICGSAPSEACYLHAIESWYNQGIVLHSPLAGR